MGLAETQRVLAHLYTDAQVREAFFANPTRVGESFGLTADEAEQLAQSPAPRVEFFARSLRQKRLNEVAKLLPLTHRVLGLQFSKLFERYAETAVLKGMKKHHEDAIGFSAFFEEIARRNGFEQPWAVELVRYEAAWVKTMNPTCRWLIHWFRYSMRELVQSLTREESPLGRLGSPTVVIWFRFPTGRLRHVVFSLSARDVLAKIVDGFRKVAGSARQHNLKSTGQDTKSG